MFYRTACHRYVNLDNVMWMSESVEGLGSGGNVFNVRFVDGSSETFRCHSSDPFEWLGIRVIAAPVGFEVLRIADYVPGQDDVEVVSVVGRESVIAFTLVAPGDPMIPITMQSGSLADTRQEWVVSCPNGQIEALWDSTYKDIGEYKASVVAYRKRKESKSA